jgi:hypothetical protein
MANREEAERPQRCNYRACGAWDRLVPILFGNFAQAERAKGVIANESSWLSESGVTNCADKMRGYRFSRRHSTDGEERERETNCGEEERNGRRKRKVNHESLKESLPMSNNIKNTISIDIKDEYPGR